MNKNEPWFYCSDIPGVGEQIILDERESRHVGGSRRLRAGDKLKLFDGKGALAEMAFVEKSNKGIYLDILGREQHEPSKNTIHLACTIPKGDRAGVLLDMATQVGMTDFTPLICEHGLNERTTDTAQQRWQRIVIESCKQSRRLFLPRIHPAEELETLLHNGKMSEHKLWMADATGNKILEYENDTNTINSSNLLLVGPEGGFSDSELSLAKDYQTNLVRLSKHILRVETAAVLLIAAVWQKF